MALAAQRDEWSRTGISIAWMVAAHTGKNIDPRKIIPPQFQATPPKQRRTQQQKESESKHGWELLRKWTSGQPVQKIRPQKKEK